jgi:hypothetical protein
MVANTTPIFSLAPDNQWAIADLTAANTTKSGTSGTKALVFTAGAEGGRIEKIIARPLGTNVATVLRVFMNNGSDDTVRDNNTLIAEMTLPATTLSEVAAQPAYEIPLNLPVNATDRIYCTIGTAVAAGFALTAIGSKY